MRKEGGCDSYIQTSATIFFPGDEIRCDLCPFLEEHPRYQCRRTGEYLRDTRTKGIWCPLVIKEGEKIGEL